MLSLMASLIRLFLDQPIALGQSVSLSRDAAHYLFGVMRLEIGAEIRVFDGQNGEFAAVVSQGNKRNGILEITEATRPQISPPDLWLCFAPIKKARTDFIVEKAAEMGAARILPMQTQFTNSDRIRQDRLQAHAVEAAEQCGGTFVPPVDALIKFTRLLDDWPAERQIMFCDEALVGQAQTLAAFSPQPWAIFIGPEGGFSPTERARLHALPNAHAVSLGPRILRADTAAVAAMALWQNTLGDWL